MEGLLPLSDMNSPHSFSTIGSDGVLGGVEIELVEGGRDKTARLSDVMMNLGLVEHDHM